MVLFCVFSLKQVVYPLIFVCVMISWWAYFLLKKNENSIRGVIIGVLALILWIMAYCVSRFWVFMCDNPLFLLTG